MATNSNSGRLVSRALLVGAMAGAGTALVNQKKALQQGQVANQMMVLDMAKMAVKTAAISGASTYAAEKMADKPGLSLLTILSVGAAGIYLLDHYLDTKNEK